MMTFKKLPPLLGNKNWVPLIKGGRTSINNLFAYYQSLKPQWMRDCDANNVPYVLCARDGEAQ